MNDSWKICQTEEKKNPPNFEILFSFPGFLPFFVLIAGTLDCWGAAGRAAWWRRRGCRLTRRLAYRASAPR